jgi:aminoglycoside phosphotransferase (APT) family kinase protein
MSQSWTVEPPSIPFGMTTPVHDDEPDTGAEVVQILLGEEATELAALPHTSLTNTGSDNALYRLGTEFVVRLPRFADAAARLGVELDCLPRLVHLPAAVPRVAFAGSPTDVYPFRWAVLPRPG